MNSVRAIRLPRLNKLSEQANPEQSGDANPHVQEQDSRVPKR